jgi:serine protease Do
MQRLRLGIAMTTALLGAIPASAQLRFPDPTVLVAPGPTIGARVRDLASEDVQKARLESPGGVFVESVEPGRPADEAGIKSGDVIVEFDGERVRSVRNFTRLVSETPPQRTVKTVVVRDGSRQTLNITPDSGRRNDALRIQPNRPFLRPIPRSDLPPFPPLGTLRYRGYIGVTLEEIGSQMADYFGVSSGALVAAVDVNSPAARAGLKAGDVITSAGGQAVKRPEDVAAAIRQARPGASLELKVMRDKKETAITVEVPAAVPMLL